MIKRINLAILQSMWGDLIHRFPFVMISALLTTFFLMNHVGTQFSNDGFSALKYSVAAYTATLALINLQVLREAFSISNLGYYLSVAGVFILAVLYMYILPSVENEGNCLWTFAAGLCIVLHLTLCLIPYLRKYDTQFMLNYNFDLLFAWLRATLYGLIIFTAFSLTILALDKLFNVHFDSYVYLKSFVLVAGIFHSFYFLSAFPANFENQPVLHEKSVFSILVKYAFTPIVLLFAIILYAYIIKLFMTGQPIDSWVSDMILWYFIVGIFTWLCTGYEAVQTHFILHRLFKKWFFLLSLPLIVLLLSTVGHQINESGIMDDNYLKALVAVWLIVISIISFILRRKVIIWFPASLIFFVVIGLMSGPLSICTVPVKNQQKRLINLLEEKAVIQNGVLIGQDTIVHNDSSGKISDIMYYLGRKNALQFLKRYDKENIISPDTKNWEPGAVMERLGIASYFYGPERMEDFIYNLPTKQLIDIGDFDKIIPLYNDYEEATTPLYAQVFEKGIRILENAKTIAEFDIRPILHQKSTNGEDIDKGILLESENLTIRLFLISCYAKGKGPSMKINEIQGIVLYNKMTE